MMKLLFASAAAVLCLLQSACAGSDPTSPVPANGERLVSRVLAGGFEIPWAMAFLPDGGIVLTERPGRILHFDAEQEATTLLAEIEDVAHQGEGGLLGIAVHPRFDTLPYIYVYYTYASAGSLLNRVVRYSAIGTSLRDRKVILEGIPGASIHNGGRLKFGPDGCLYVTTGDAAVPQLAQDANSLAGKILRLMDDGSIPLDNPLPGSPVFSMGHRNPQGLAWDDDGRLWATEHGASATDELNLIVAGRNYGWPVIRGDDEVPGMESPALHSSRETWAPSGLAHIGGSLFFVGLRGNGLYEVTLPDLSLVKHLDGDYGRLRDVVPGPDGALYVLTSNRDGRGRPVESDDRLIRVDTGRAGV